MQLKECSMADWVIYGAYGYTGRLITEEALAQGHRPLLAGRSEEKLRRLASTHDLEYVAVDLKDRKGLKDMLSGVQLVVNAAGPFHYTARPMIRACLSTKRHYLDITGEIPVFEQVFALGRRARESEIALISGVGFDVVPTDCLASHVAERIDSPVELEIAFTGLGGVSTGTAKTFLRGAHAGTLVRRNGKLQPAHGRFRKRVHFSDKTRSVIPISWGDLSTAYRSTGIPDITTYTAVPEEVRHVFTPVTGALSALSRTSWGRKIADAIVERFVKGPDARTRETSKSYVWARAVNGKGEGAEARFEGPEAYRLTAITTVMAVDRVLGGTIHGGLTPSQAFGNEFAEQIPGATVVDG